MFDLRAQELWDQILVVLDEKMQYALLTEAKNIVNVALEGNDLLLTACTEDGAEFFNSEVNGQRLILQVRSVINLDSVKARYVEASPLKK